MLPTKKWHIKIEFDWDAWDTLLEEHIVYLVSDLVPQNLHKSLEITVKEENEKIS